MGVTKGRIFVFSKGQNLPPKWNFKTLKILSDKENWEGEWVQVFKE